MKKRKRRFRGKIKYKYMMTCIGISVAIICILTVSYYGYFNHLYEKQNQEYVHNMTQQAKESFSITMENIDNIVLEMQSADEIQKYLYRIDHEKYSELEAYFARDDVKKCIYEDILWIDSVANVYLESEEGHIERIEKSGGDPIYCDAQKKEFIYAGGGKTVWLGVDESGEFMQAGAQINSTRTMKSLGFVMLQVPVEYFKDKLEAFSAVHEGTTILTDSKGNILIGANNDQSTSSRQIKEIIESEERMETVSINQNENYLIVSELGYNDWFLVSLVEKMGYMDVFYEIRGFIALTVMSVMVGMLVIITLFAERFTKNINTLRDMMERFGQGDFNVICAVQSDDEIGQLSQHFNMMVYNINDLIDTVYNETMLRQDAELKSLRMQINPHFLYNTLDMIAWISRDKGVEEVSDIALSLGNMMRYTIKGSDMAELGQEINTIKQYIFIQKYRYGERINFNIDVEDVVRSVKIPKLLIQPLIENAVIHGVENIDSGGIVTLSVKKVGRNICIEVSDNGIGIEKEKIKAILSNETDFPEEIRESIGLKNVNHRLKIRYGENHGLIIRSEPGKGTDVIMNIPFEEDLYEGNQSTRTI